MSVNNTTVTVTIAGMTCKGCGVSFGVEAGFLANAREEGDGKHWFRCTNPRCPWEAQSYQESEMTRLRKQVEAVKRSRDFFIGECGAERERTRAEQRRSAALRGVLTKTKKRVAAGVCPCCNRTFRDLARHMKGKHPSYGMAEGAL